MLVTLSGMLMQVREGHQKNASSPMLVTLFGMLMQVREGHQKNADFPNACHAVRYVDAGQRFTPVYLLLVDYQYYTF